MTRWVCREAVVIVKAYPNPSAKYHETVCVAAVTPDEGLVRLYPVQFRSMPRDKQFKKYQRIRLRMARHEGDNRPESYRLDEDSIERLAIIEPKQDWADRRAVIEPVLSRSMCEIQRVRQTTGKSLGTFRPRQIQDLLIGDADPEWGGKKQAATDQLTLFDPQSSDRLEKIPFVFKYKYCCEDEGCHGHTQSIIDWEIMELYRNIRASASGPEEIKAKIRQKYLDQLCGKDRDTYLFVGNHSLHHQTFMVLGVFWPPKPKPGRQLSLFG